LFFFLLLETTSVSLLVLESTCAIKIHSPLTILELSTIKSTAELARKVEIREVVVLVLDSVLTFS
jgi:hypothetical protein